MFLWSPDGGHPRNLTLTLTLTLIRMEAIQERIKTNMSLDHLARVLVDILQDSSRVLDTILSTRQRSMIELVYRGYQMNRPKFYILMCSRYNSLYPLVTPYNPL